MQINDEFNFVKGDVIDLGSAPGGCLQALRNLTNGKVVGVDERPVKQVPGTEFYHQKFETLNLLQKFDTIFSDVGPLTKLNEVDMDKALELEKDVVKFMKKYLKTNGNFVMKFFVCEGVKGLLDELSVYFKKVVLFKPEASRKGNKEMYAVCLNKTMME